METEVTCSDFYVILGTNEGEKDFYWLARQSAWVGKDVQHVWVINDKWNEKWKKKYLCYIYLYM